MEVCICKKEIDFDIFESIGPLTIRIEQGKKLNFQISNDGKYKFYNEFDFFIGSLTPEKFEKHFTIDNI